MTTGKTFVAVKTFGAFATYSCVECAAVVVEHDRDSNSPIFQARQRHLDWHAGVIADESRDNLDLEEETCDE